MLWVLLTLCGDWGDSERRYKCWGARALERDRRGAAGRRYTLGGRSDIVIIYLFGSIFSHISKASFYAHERVTVRQYVCVWLHGFG